MRASSKVPPPPLPPNPHDAAAMGDERKKIFSFLFKRRQHEGDAVLFFSIYNRPYLAKTRSVEIGNLKSK